MIRFVTSFPTDNYYVGKKKYIIMDENINPNSIPYATSGAVLLPPPDVFIEYMDTENMPLFISKFSGYLLYNAIDFIVSFIYDGMFMGSNIDIVLDENYKIYFETLLYFMNCRYGLLYDSVSGMCSMEQNPEKLENLRLDLINLGLVNPYEATQKIYPNVINFGG